MTNGRNWGKTERNMLRGEGWQTCGLRRWNLTSVCLLQHCCNRFVVEHSSNRHIHRIWLSFKQPWWLGLSITMFSYIYFYAKIPVYYIWPLVWLITPKLKLYFLKTTYFQFKVENMWVTLLDHTDREVTLSHKKDHVTSFKLNIWFHLLGRTATIGKMLILVIF